MTIDCVIVGQLMTAAKRTTNANGDSIATAVVIAPIQDGDGYLKFNVICIDETAANALLALAEGDMAGVAGELPQKQRVLPQGPPIDLVAHVVLREYRAREHQKDELPLDHELPGAA